ncbi:peptidoglycan bridge formation glycyltransferase FemA/FemB family protein [Streptomyces vinaceus]|uniref:peptidoglycan bridge formation glycyltransferase FemA/FemB family protein n=1 Tax=Streptomyces vinaceus TaxID=1960 RepID=UPI0035D7216B
MRVNLDLAGGQEELAARTLTEDEYLASLTVKRGASYPQYPYWAAVKNQWRSEYVGRHARAGAPVGAALVLYRRLPGTRKYFTYVPEGPVADWEDPTIDKWLGPLMNHLRRAGAFAARVGPSPGYQRWHAAVLKAATGPGRRVAVLVARHVESVGATVADRLRSLSRQRCGSDNDGDAQPRYVFSVPLAGRTLDDL